LGLLTQQQIPVTHILKPVIQVACMMMLDTLVYAMMIHMEGKLLNWTHTHYGLAIFFRYLEYIGKDAGIGIELNRSGLVDLRFDR
jgi:small basic protein